nr:embryonic polyadenylate-binding protein 2 isoform X1 [Microcebus murinus]
MWPFLSRALFPPPTETWLQTVSSDPEAQGWGAWEGTKKTPLGPGDGGGKKEEDAEEDQGEDEGFLLPLLEWEHLAECPVPDEELEAIRLKLCTMEQAAWPPPPPGAQARAPEEEPTGAAQLLSPETPGRSWGARPTPPRTQPSPRAWRSWEEPALPPGWGRAGSEPPKRRKDWAADEAPARPEAAPHPPAGHPFLGNPEEKVEADHRSVYVGNVDYGGSAAELEAHFNRCGEIHRVTILCDKFSGHPKGYAYIEFATERSARAAVELDDSVFRGRVIKVLPKRTNVPGISSTDRGGLRGHPGSRGAPFLHSGLQGRPRFRPRGPNRGRGKFSPWFSPY